MTISTHDNQIHLLIGGARQQHVAHRNVLCFYMLRLGLDTVAGKMEAMDAVSDFFAYILTNVNVLGPVSSQPLISVV